ncbi:MAG: hypothetical protein UT53_C0003G0013 [Candidatus Yanofskybacteria bacterium GW2011_GWD2_39_48]|uniref:Type II secretion system protein n=1 Tax=Candidatus Yanofskybacteria bacterium GW2011_GWD2_39_48 TaxID=1619031 RepID=A0A0G0P7L1_9BACT|nr:MAG: hypothetical protein UT53_C0003G0013 [Candidatus Yanofskybacteria bacterium GW2011_GWD2_39_48]
MAFHQKKSESGFTLVDILVAATIMTLMTGILLANFSKARINLSESSAIIIGAIRKAEAKAISSALINGTDGPYHPCGYGVMYNNISSVAIFSGPIEENCTDNKYGPSYSVFETIKLVDPRIEIRNISRSFYDIFFRPPDPRMYIDGIANFGSSERILISRIGASCDEQNCQTICVYGTGRIETFPNLIESCP